MFRVVFGNNNSVAMKASDGWCRAYKGQSTDRFIKGECSAVLGEDIRMPIHKSVSIDRQSGKLLETFGREAKKVEFTYYGVCEKTSPRF